MSMSTILITYFICGIGFAASFEYLVYKTSYRKTPVKTWERLFWIVSWPYLLLEFLTAYFKK